MSKRWLQEKFTEFYLEAQKHLAAIREGRWDPGEQEQTAAGHYHGRLKGPDQAWDSLYSLLRQQEDEVREGVGVSPELHQKAEYAMVCLAHDLFTLHLPDWPGKNGWLRQPLERAIFKHEIGGGEFFNRMDELLAHGDSEDADDVALAEVYYKVLSLGFFGKYSMKARIGHNPPEVEIRRKNLYKKFRGFRERQQEPDRPRDSARGPDPASVISLQPYGTIRAGNKETTFRPPAVWQSLTFLGAVIVIIGLALFLSVRWLRSDLRQDLDNIDERIARPMQGG